jgi:ribosomal protein S25
VVSQRIFGEDATVSKEVEVVLTEDAWDKMREIEKNLVYSANASNSSRIALPTFTRMSTSLLKLAMLYAASRQEPVNFEITVELRDILQAAFYVSKWAPHTIHMMTNIGKTNSERQIQKVLRAVRTHPGITRAECMRRHHLQAMPAKHIFSTLEERGLISLKQEGRGYTLWPS